MTLEKWDETKLTPEQERRYRASARRLYTPGARIHDYWHPVFREECRRMNNEAGVVAAGDRYDAPKGGADV